MSDSKCSKFLSYFSNITFNFSFIIQHFQTSVSFDTFAVFLTIVTGKNFISVEEFFKTESRLVLIFLICLHNQSSTIISVVSFEKVQMFNQVRWVRWFHRTQACCYGNIETDEVCIGITIVSVFKHSLILLIVNLYSSGDALWIRAKSQILIKKHQILDWNCI